MMLLSGCASMDKEECATADWYTVGLEDGAKGRGSSGWASIGERAQSTA